jgi:hypothetical protein
MLPLLLYHPPPLLYQSYGEVGKKKVRQISMLFSISIKEKMSKENRKKTLPKKQNGSNHLNPIKN